MPRKKEVLSMQMQGQAKIEDDGNGNISLSFTEDASQQKSIIGDVKAAGFCADDKLLSSFVKSLCDRLAANGLITKKEKGFSAASIVTYIQDRRKGKNEKELASLLADAVGYCLKSPPKGINQIEAGAAGNVPMIKAPNSLIAHKRALGKANVGNTLSPDMVQSLFVGISPDSKERVETPYIFIPREADAENENPARAFYDACVESAWCAIWAAYRKPVKMTIYNAYAVFTGADERAKRKGRDNKGAAKYERFAAACDRLAMEKAYINASKEAGRRRVFVAPSRVPLVYAIDDTDMGGGVVKAGVSAFVLTGKPVLLEYSEMHGQVISQEKSLFEILDANGKPMDATEGRTLIKYYLLRRVYDILSGANNAFITWEKLHEMIGDAEKSRSSKKNSEAFALLVLENWKGKGFIKGYRHKEKGAAGVEILN